MRSRVPVSTCTEQQLRLFFRQRRCVVSLSTTNTEWHHLDDDRGNTVFANLIPVQRDINLQILRYRAYESDNATLRGYNPSLTPDALLILSRQHFSNLDVPPAYGAARLAIWLQKLFPHVFPTSTIVSSMGQALSCARHAAAPQLIRDILSRDFAPIVRSQRLLVSERVEAQLDLANTLQDYCIIHKADDLLDAARRKIHATNNPATNARLMRRRAISGIYCAADPRAARTLLVEATKQSPLGANDIVGNVNALAWCDLAIGKAAAARDRLLEITAQIFDRKGEYRKDLVAPWNALESLLTLVTAAQHDYRKHRRNTMHIVEQLRYCCERFAQRGAQLRPIALELATSYRGVRVASSRELYMRLVGPREEDNVQAIHQSVDSLAQAIAT